jgi:hypothetical protein
MVLREEQAVLHVDIRVESAKLLDEPLSLPELLAHPQRHREAERRKTPWRKREIRLEQPLELDERLLVKHDLVDVAQRSTCVLQAIADRFGRKALVMLLTREALLLSGSEDRPILDQRSRTVVVERRDSEEEQLVS